MIIVTAKLFVQSYMNPMKKLRMTILENKNQLKRYR